MVKDRAEEEEDPDAEPEEKSLTHEAPKGKMQRAGEESGAESEERMEEESEVGECQCTHCGMTVRPTPVKTGSGAIVNRCPKCGKFFKREDTATEPCSPEPSITAEEEDKEALAPLEVDMTNRLKVLLATYLPRVWGIPRSDKRLQAITDTVTPEQTSSPWNLHAHIKNFAPSADDRHLEAIITKIYSQLEAEGFIMESPASQYQPKYGRRGQKARDGHHFVYGDHGHGPSYYEEEEDFEGGGRGRRPKPLKVVVDGQTIETDAEGLMAIRRFQLEEAADKRDEREHQLSMKKLEEEIKRIAKGSDEAKVAVQVGDQTISVPASIAPLYLKGGGGESEDLKAMRAQLANMEKQLQATEKKLDDKEMEELKTQIAGLYGKIDELAARDPMEKIKEHEAYARDQGYTRTGKTTLDVISEGITNLDKRAQQLLSHSRGKGEDGEDFAPEIKRTPKERKETADGIQEKLEQRNKIIDAENRLLEAASNL